MSDANPTPEEIAALGAQIDQEAESYLLSAHALIALAKSDTIDENSPFALPVLQRGIDRTISKQADYADIKYWHATNLLAAVLLLVAKNQTNPEEN